MPPRRHRPHVQRRPHRRPPAANHDSGRQRGKRFIGGERAAVRSVLDLAAHAAKQGNALVRAFADRLAAAGKAPKVIRIAVARKLLVIANAVLRTGQSFGKTEAEIAWPPP